MKTFVSRTFRGSDDIPYMIINIKFYDDLYGRVPASNNFYFLYWFMVMNNINIDTVKEDIVWSWHSDCHYAMPMCFSQGFAAHNLDSKKETAARRALKQVRKPTNSYPIILILFRADDR